MRSFAVVAITVAGCNQIYGIETTSPRPPADAEADAPPLCPEGKSQQRQSLPPVADTTLIDDNNPQSHGDTPEVLLRLGPLQMGIWKFDVETALDDAVDAELVLPYVVREIDCGSTGTCTSCDSQDFAGPIVLYPIVSTWDEAGATWLCRLGGGGNGCPGMPGVGARWDQPGAGGADRGPAVATAQHVAASDTELAMGDSLPVLRSWVDGGMLSLLAIPLDNARAWIPAQTTEANHLACRPPGLPSLVVTYCE
jgi:hypothetical protein